MKQIVIAFLFIGYFLVVPLLNGQHMSSMMEMMGTKNQQILEEDILDQLNEKENKVYQQLNSEQKSLVIKIANQFSKNSCEQMMKMHKQMMKDNMMNQKSSD